MLEPKLEALTESIKELTKVIINMDVSQAQAAPATLPEAPAETEAPAKAKAKAKVKAKPKAEAIAEAPVEAADDMDFLDGSPAETNLEITVDSTKELCRDKLGEGVDKDTIFAELTTLGASAITDLTPENLPKFYAAVQKLVGPNDG